jgi:outer membrane protein OmpA-like peptidoglycan-associated protein/pimeloyl-ACP methyl ester carboxylesterase
MNSDRTSRFLERAERASRYSYRNRRQSETSFLQQLMSELGVQVLAPGFSPAELFRSLLCNCSSTHVAHDVLDVLAKPSQRLRDALRPGDWMLRFVPATGDLGHVSVLASDDLLTQPMLAYERISADSTQPGYYGLVIEAGAFPHDGKEPFARRFLDIRGRVPAHTVILRPLIAEWDFFDEVTTPYRSIRESLVSPEHRVVSGATKAGGGELCGHQIALLDSEDDSMIAGASQACYGAFSMAGPGFASALGMIAHVMIESDAEKMLNVERGAQLFVDDQARGSVNPRMVRFLLDKNPNLSANDKDLIRQGGYRRPDFILHASKRQEFDEIKSNSDAGRKEGLAQLKQIAAWMRARGLPYVMGSSYVPSQERYIPVLNYRVAGLPVDVLLKVERLQSGLILYQYCIRADLTKVVKGAVVAIFIVLMAFLIRYVRLPISLPRLPIRLPPGAPDLIVIPPIKQPRPLEVTDIATSNELRIAHEHFSEEQVRDLALLVEPELLSRNSPGEGYFESDLTAAPVTWDAFKLPAWLKIDQRNSKTAREPYLDFDSADSNIANEGEQVPDRVVHVYLDDLAHPLGSSNAISRKVAETYARIGITVAVELGSFAVQKFGERLDKIQITILSANIDAQDEKAIRDTLVNLGNKSASAVTETVSVLRGNTAGFSAGFPTDPPLSKAIFVKEITPQMRSQGLRSFSLMYPNPAEAAEALDVYFYADTIIHELGHTFGLGPHTSDTGNYMYAPPAGQPQYDRLTDIVGRPGARQLINDPLKWGTWVRHELSNSERSFTQDQVRTMRATLERFIPSPATAAARGQKVQGSESWSESQEPAKRPQGFQCFAGTATQEDALPASQGGSWDIEAVPPVVLPPARATTVPRAGFRPDVSVLCPPPPVILERFEFDGGRPKAAHRARIGTLAQEIIDSQTGADPIHTLCILGHTDDIGSETDNQDLGAQRAIAVATELEAAIESRQPGLAATLGLTVESRGEEAPLVPNTSTTNRLRNRRVEIFLNRRWRRTTPAIGACPTVAVGPDPTAPTPFAVGEDSFSATITLFGTSIPVSGTVFYPADSAGNGTTFATALTTLAPLVVFAHGNHATFHHPTDRFRESCGASSGFVALENHRGYEYLQRVLAGMGMVAISVNANVANCTGLSPTNIHYRGALILAAIQHFQNLNSGGASRFVGRLDLAKIALFGHSRGGEAVLVAAETLPTIVSLSAARVLGVLSLAPTDAGATSGRPSGFAYVAMLPAADGDVSDNAGAKFYDQATPSPFKCQIYIDAANHNFFNRNWPVDEGHGAARLSRVEHESILLAYACAFFRGLLLGHNTLRFLRVDVLPPGVPADKVQVSFEATGATTIDDHENRNISLNTLGAPTTQSGGLTAAEFDFQQGVLSSFNRSFFGKTVGMVAQTSVASGLFRSQLPTSVNLTGREVWVRVAEVYNGVAVPTTGTGYQIGLEDAAGGTSFGDSNDVGGLPRPFDRRNDDVARIGVDLTKTMLKTHRFAAACFVRSGFDPTHVRAVLLRLDRGDGRALAFDQLQIV